MKITAAFLQPLNDAGYCPQPYAPNKAVRYDPGSDGTSVADFETSDKGKEVKTQYRVGLGKLKTFLLSNGDSSRNEAATKAIDDFGAKVEGGVRGFFSTQAGRLYGLGKGSLDSLCVDVEDSRIPLAERQSVVRNLAAGLNVCSEGACSNLIIAADNLRLSVQGPRGHAKKVWESLFDQAIVEFCQRTHGHRYNYSNNEIHYVNGYRNYFAHTLGLTERPDSFVPKEEFEPHLEEATRFVNETVTADALVRHLAETCLADVREHFKDYLDRPLSETETADCYQRYESIDAALQSRYGDIECLVLINADENKGTEEAPYTVIDKPDLLMRAIARNLRKAGVLEKEKFKTEASETAADGKPGRQIKRITDDAHYVKERLPGQSHATYRSVQPADLHRLSLPQERARRMLKNALISTTDRDQLRLLDPSGVWDLITNPEGGLLEDATQWLDAMVHFAVKRYRESNPDANKFLLLKAQEKLSRNESPVQEKRVVDLMIDGEDAIAAVVASSVTTFDWRDKDGSSVLHIAREGAATKC